MKITAIFATYSNVGLYQSSLSELELLDLVVRLAFHGSITLTWHVLLFYL